MTFGYPDYPVAPDYKQEKEEGGTGAFRTPAIALAPPGQAEWALLWGPAGQRSGLTRPLSGEIQGWYGEHDCVGCKKSPVDSRLLGSPRT